MIQEPKSGVGDERGLLGRWISALEREHVLMGAREATAGSLGKWLICFGPATEGDESATHELHKLVAFHARSLGGEGRPASAVLMQVLLLEDLVREEARALKVCRDLVRIVADAHALGASERTRNRHHLEIRDFTPVLRLGERSILGFLLGPMERDLIDALMGRVLRECVRAGATDVVIDCFGAARDNDVFHRTVQAFMRHEVGGRVRLTLSGLRDPDATKEVLVGLGIKADRLNFEADVNAAVATALGIVNES